MVSLPVYDAAGSKVGDYEIDPAEIAPSINTQLLHDVVVMYQASARQGSHKTKTRSEVAGANKKMYRQKGTGNARAGSRRSGIRRGGGHIFAKRPRDYSYRLNKKAIRAATRMAIAGKIQDEQVVVIQDLAFDEPKTAQMAEILKVLNLAGQTTLVAIAGYDSAVYKSARNIAGISVCPVSDLNALDVLKPRKLLVTTDALDAIKSGSFASHGSDEDTADSSNPESIEA